MAVQHEFDEQEPDQDDSSHLIGGRYRLEERIGEGQLGVTHRAYDTKLRRQVAIKLLPAEYGTDKTATARFEQEARAAVAVDHRNVARIYDFGDHEETCYLVTQYVAGRNLKHYLTHAGPQAPSAAVQIISQLLHGLGAIHEAGIVHGEVKPQDIILGDDGVLRVTGFGISHGSNRGKQPVENVTVGDAAYLSPEQIRGEPLSAATDLYAAGVILFQLLTGRLPFTIEHPVAALVVPLQKDPPAPSRFAHDVSPALDAAVKRALAKNPADRFGSAAAMDEALEAAVFPHPRLRDLITNPVPDWIGAVILVLIAAVVLGAVLITSLGGGSNGSSVSLTEPPHEQAALSAGFLVPTSTPDVTPTVRVVRVPVAAKPQTTATESVLAATERPSATKTPEPKPTATQKKSASSKPRKLTFDAADWKGGRYRGDEEWYGRAWTAIYGAQSQYPRASLTASLRSTPKADAILTITGLDDEWALNNPIAITVNGVEIFSGPSPFPSWDGVGHGEQAAWTSVDFTVPKGVLKKGTNQIEVINLSTSANVGTPPYILVSQAVLKITR